jgi:anaerobic magnesium-protoporphyrin IX monomethyl ester cyclase
MKVLLIRPPAIHLGSEPEVILNEPLGLLYLAGYLKKNKKEVAVIDCLTDSTNFRIGEFYGRGMSYEALSAKIKELSPDIVGISYVFTEYSKGSHDVAKIVKDISGMTLVVCGGAAACASVAGVLEDRNFDLLVKGEGEETLLEIVEKFEQGLDIKEIAGTALALGDSIRINPARKFISNLDSLPFPARDLLDMSKYCNDPYSLDRGMRYPRLSMVTSRGCPFNCVFCIMHSVWEHSYRMRSAGNVVDEIESLVKNYGVKEIVFYDDNMTFDKKRTNEICQEIQNRRLGIKWSVPSGVAIWTLDKETVKNMKRAGCYKITFGLESGSESTRKFIHKDFIDFDKAKELIKFCNRIGLWTVSSFVVGFPYETLEDIKKTLDFALESDIDMASFYSVTPYPGSELYEIYKKEGSIQEPGRQGLEQWQGNIRFAMMDTKYLRKEEIDSLVRDMKLKFTKKRLISFLNPLRIARKAGGKDEVRYIFRIMKTYFWFLIRAIRP